MMHDKAKVWIDQRIKSERAYIADGADPAMVRSAKEIVRVLKRILELDDAPTSECTGSRSIAYHDAGVRRPMIRRARLDDGRVTCSICGVGFDTADLIATDTGGVPALLLPRHEWVR